jgi:predicted aldo/keto reductase-like oxidoreductase
MDFETGLDVLRIICRHSRGSEITGERIAEQTGWDPTGEVPGGVPPREIADAVRIAVEKGVRVASNTRGYFKPSEQERREYLDREKRRLLSLAVKISKAKKNERNELELFDEEQKQEAA